MQKKWRQYWLFQVIGWGGFAIINIFFHFLFDKLTEGNLWRIVATVTVGFLVSQLMREVIKRLNILQKKLNKQVLQFLVLTFFMSILASYACVDILRYFNMLKDVDQQLLEESSNPLVDKMLLVLFNAFTYFILLFIWNLIYFMYHYVSKSRKQQLDTLRLESLVKELELQTIKAHINPHFIFNSLNSIRALVDENPQRARAAVTELSNILRSSMQAEKMETVPFEKELSIVKDYLALENMRFEDRLKIEYDIDEDTLHQPVPPMMLQTLVENAIKHGINKQISGGIVKVTSDFKDNYHVLSVQNTGYLNGYKAGSEGFGLSSTTNRLSLLYGNKAKFEIKQMTASLVEAKVLLPANGV